MSCLRKIVRSFIYLSLFSVTTHPLIGWGSDEGLLANLVEYAKSRGKLAAVDPIVMSESVELLGRILRELRPELSLDRVKEDITKNIAEHGVEVGLILPLADIIDKSFVFGIPELAEIINPQIALLDSGLATILGREIGLPQKFGSRIAKDPAARVANAFLKIHQDNDMLLFSAYLGDVAWTRGLVKSNRRQPGKNSVNEPRPARGPDFTNRMGPISSATYEDCMGSCNMWAIGTGVAVLGETAWSFFPPTPVKVAAGVAIGLGHGTAAVAEYGQCKASCKADQEREKAQKEAQKEAEAREQKEKQAQQERDQREREADRKEREKDEADRVARDAKNGFEGRFSVSESKQTYVDDIVSDGDMPVLVKPLNPNVDFIDSRGKPSVERLGRGTNVRRK